MGLGVLQILLCEKYYYPGSKKRPEIAIYKTLAGFLDYAIQV